MRVMFLGGTYDHAIREITGRPREIYVQRSVGTVVGTVDPDPLRETYKRWTVRADPIEWDVYVLAGHQPSRRHLIDANLRGMR